HRREPVAVEAGAVADPEHLGAGADRRGHARAPFGAPAKAWAKVSQCAASPVATRSVSSTSRRWVTTRAKSSAGPVTTSPVEASSHVHTPPAGAVSSMRKGACGGTRSVMTY